MCLSSKKINSNNFFFELKLLLYFSPLMTKCILRTRNPHFCISQPEFCYLYKRPRVKENKKLTYDCQVLPILSLKVYLPNINVVIGLEATAEFGVTLKCFVQTVYQCSESLHLFIFIHSQVRLLCLIVWLFLLSSFISVLKFTRITSVLYFFFFTQNLFTFCCRNFPLLSFGRLAFLMHS